MMGGDGGIGSGRTVAVRPGGRAATLVPHITPRPALTFPIEMSVRGPVTRQS